MDNRPFDVAVVGAGVAGLWSAALLARSGLRVAVLERGEQPGGRARSWRDDPTGIDVDIGPHVISSEHRNFLAMLEFAGTAGEVLWQPEPLVTLLDSEGALRFPNKRWMPPFHALPMLPVALRRLSITDLLSHWRLSWEVARASETSLREVDGESALHWLTRLGVSPHAIDWAWRTSMLALLNVRLEECSAASALRAMRLFAGIGGIHFGFPRTGLSRLYVPACISAVESRGGMVRMQCEVTAIERGAESFTVRCAGGQSVSARASIAAIPPGEAALLFAGDAELSALSQAASAFGPVPYVSTMLWFDRRITDDRFWGRIWSPGDLNTDFYDLSNIRPELARGGSVVACNSIGPLARPELDDASIVARTHREVAQFAPDAHRARIVHSRVHRIAMAIPHPRPGTETRRPPVRTHVNGLFLAGDWCDTALPCSMESAARSGALAAEAVMAHLGKPMKFAIAAPETTGLPALLRRPG